MGFQHQRQRSGYRIQQTILVPAGADIPGKAQECTRIKQHHRRDAIDKPTKKDGGQKQHVQQQAIHALAFAAKERLRQR